MPRTSAELPILKSSDSRFAAGTAVLVSRDVRRAPDLQRVVFLRLVRRLEQDHAAVRIEREAIADDRRLDGLRDDVVGEQNVVAGGALIENKQRVLAISRRDPALEAQADRPVS